MAYLDNTKKNFRSPAELTLCLTHDECELLLPVIRATLKKQLKKQEKYQDIHESGEATERQENELTKADNAVSALQQIEENAIELIQAFKKSKHNF